METLTRAELYLLSACDIASLVYFSCILTFYLFITNDQNTLIDIHSSS